MSKSKKLVFFGSGPVGRATLENLKPAGFNIEAIVTKPKAPHHRGSMPVLEFAQIHQINTYTPTNKSELAEIFKKSLFKSSLGLVVDYGLIIPKPVIDSFPLGILNSHFSLLPQWRGADPITFAVLSGQSETGVSLMLINKKLDEGQLIAQKSLKIGPDITTPQLTDQLVKLSNKMLLKYIPEYLAGTIKLYPQPKEPVSHSRRLVKEDGILDWGKPAMQLEREVRAYAGWPRSVTRVFGHKIIVTKAHVAKNEKEGSLVMRANPGWLEIVELIAPSGRIMSGADFIRGYSD